MRKIFFIILAAALLFSCKEAAKDTDNSSKTEEATEVVEQAKTVPIIDIVKSSKKYMYVHSWVNDVIVQEGGKGLELVIVKSPELEGEQHADYYEVAVVEHRAGGDDISASFKYVPAEKKLYYNNELEGEEYKEAEFNQKLAE